MTLSGGGATAWRWERVLLVLPFLAVIVLYRGLSATVPTFHGSDELIFHFPIITEFASQLPWPHVSDYNSSTAPLFHVVFAVFAKVVGENLAILRLINVGLSLAAVFVFYNTVSEQASRFDAFCFSLVCALSPYFFGASFILLTDNLGILFAALAVQSCIVMRRSPATGRWLAMCLWICLATLTRQLYVWLAIGAAPQVFASGQTMQQRLSKIAGLAAACIPLLLLLLTWKGMTPPMRREHDALQHGSLTLRGGIFCIAIFGVYWALLFPDRLLAALKSLRERRLLLAALLIVTVVAMWKIPMIPHLDDDGIVWRISRSLPTPGGSGIIFWLSFPLGLLYLIGLFSSPGDFRSRVGWMALSFLLCNLPNGLVFEKYFDPFIIAFVILSDVRRDANEPIARVTRAFTVLCFALYPYVLARGAAAG